MPKKNKFIHTLNTRILLVLIILFILIGFLIGIMNSRNIRRIYENTYTEQLLLTNALMGSLINSNDVEYFVELMRNQSEDFKQRQIEFYHNRSELFLLQAEGGSEEEQERLMTLLGEFHAETEKFKKNNVYQETLESLKQLKELSRSTYVYVMADTGLQTRDGEPLFTYIFDAEDEIEYNSPEMDGLGTCDTGIESFVNVFETKKQTEKAELYEGDFGNLYFVCVPILNENGDVVAILGTDLETAPINEAIKSTALLFNSILFIVFILSVVIIFILLSQSIAKPLSGLTKTALIFAEGNLQTSVSQSTLKKRNEIGTLAHAFKNTLDATTLYLNSIPESLFIMSNKYETYFRNEQFIKRFADMQAKDFIDLLFPDNTNINIAETLNRDQNTTIVWINKCCYAVMLKEIILADMTENSILVIANDITDLMNEKENAQAAAEAKSNFLSRMSHEMRTPMNAIIGMAKVAEDSSSIENIKHCLATINSSSEQLLGIINDVLDMSKIEAGKLELQYAPMNIEKTLMKVCNLVIDSIEKKKQRFNVNISKGLKMHYIADDMRLSQVLANLLSNAVKFTPKEGTITLSVENGGVLDEKAILKFSVSDNGIGMTSEQVSRLFNAFEQADGSIARKYGGTGLGLVISQRIIEMMGGNIKVKSEYNKGTTFEFDILLEYAPQQKKVVFDGISPKDIRVLIIENDMDICNHFKNITESFGFISDYANNVDDAFSLLEKAYETKYVYDVIFLSYEMMGVHSIDLINRFNSKIDKNSVIIITSYLEWHKIESLAHKNFIKHYITKPIFPSSVLDLVNKIVGEKLKKLDIKTKTQDGKIDLSNVKILLAEDIDINREVFFALMEGTNIKIDVAENGLIAVEKFKTNPNMYDMIIMDIQMPEMDGYEATRTIRALNLPRSAEIPIVAMSANAFKEDIELCLNCGMNDHLAKPINIETVIDKIVKYTRKNHA